MKLIKLSLTIALGWLISPCINANPPYNNIFSTDKQAFIEKITQVTERYPNALACELDDVYYSPFRRDKAVMLQAIDKNPFAIRLVDPDIIGGKALALATVKKDGLSLSFVGDNYYGLAKYHGFTDDEEIVLAAVKNHGYALEFASDRLKNDKAFLLKASENNFLATTYIIRHLDINDELKQRFLQQRKDYALVLAAVSVAGSALKYAHSTLRADKTIVQNAIKHNDDTSMYKTVPDIYSLEYADASLRNDKAIVLAAVKVRAAALRGADSRLKRDKEVVLTALNNNSTLFYEKQIVFDAIDGSLKQDKDVILAMVKREGALIDKLDARWQKDGDVIAAALRTYAKAFKYADDQMKNSKALALAYFNNPHFRYLDDQSAAEIPSSVKSNREIMLEGVQIQGDWLRYVSDDLKQDKEVVLAAVKQSPDVFEYADDSLKSDKAFVLDVLQVSGNTISFVSKDLLNDEAIIAAALGNKGAESLLRANPRLRNDKDKVLIAYTQKAYPDYDSSFFKLIAPSLKRDRDVVMAAVKNNGKVLEWVEFALKKDKTVVNTALENNPTAFQYIDTSLKRDRDFVLKWAAKFGGILEHVDESLKKDKVIAEAAVKQSIYAFQHIHDDLKNDKAFVLQLLRDQELDDATTAMKYVSDRLKKDKQVVLEAVKKDALAFEYAAESVKSDRVFILELLALPYKKYSVFSHVDQALKKDKDIVLAALKQAENSNYYLWSVYNDVTGSLAQDRDVILAALQSKIADKAIKNIPTDLLSDKAIVLAAVKHQGLVLQHVDKVLQADKAVVIAAVKQNGLALEWADERLKRDANVVKAALLNNGMAFKHVDTHFQSDKSMVINALRNAPEAVQWVDKNMLDDELLAFIPVNYWPDNQVLLGQKNQ